MPSVNLSTYLNKIIAEKRAQQRHLTLSRIARLSGLHSSQLSKAMKGKEALQPDHIYALGESLKLKSIELSCLEALNEYERSSNPGRREQWSRRADKYLKEAEKLSSSLEAPQAASDSMLKYFLEPKIMLLHLFLGTQPDSKRMKDFQNSLQMSDAQLNSCIEELIHLNLIEKEGLQLKVIKDHMHLDKDSSWCSAHQNLLRMMCLKRISAKSSKKDLNFMATFSADDDAFEAMQEDFKDFLKKSERRVLKSQKKNIYQINFDLFPWL